MFQYAGIEKKRNEVIKEFNDRVVLVLIQSIEGYLTKIDMKWGWMKNVLECKWRTG